MRAIWRAVEELGFDGGRVLEPGCRRRRVHRPAPAGAQITGVELDPTTAAIARALYPRADRSAQSHSRETPPTRRAISIWLIGNVPFADVRLHDPRHNRGGHSMHNHFIVKSLALTRPGGLVAVLSSRYTLDATNPAARREMNAMADLVGAVRLPSGAHQRAAGTKVITDLLMLRRREPGAAAAVLGVGADAADRDRRSASPRRTATSTTTRGTFWARWARVGACMRPPRCSSSPTAATSPTPWPAR